MEPYLGYDFDYLFQFEICLGIIWSIKNNILDDKESKMNNINLIEEWQHPNFRFDNNKSHEKKSRTNDLLVANKEVMNKKYSENEKNQITEKKKETKEKKEKKLLGRKKGINSESGDHNKYSDDNLRRKCKHLVLDSAFKFINEKIKEKYNGNIGHGIYVKKLFMINQKQISEASILFNQDFLNKTLGEIFSVDISTRYTTYNNSHNDSLIKNLTNEKDEDKKIYFKTLFGISFSDCLKHYRGSQKIEELEGMKGFSKDKAKYKDDVFYLSCLENYIMNFEEIINNKKTRKSKKKEN